MQNGFKRSVEDLALFERYFQSCKAVTFHSEEKWLEARREYLCASDTPCVLGIGFRSNVDIYTDKTGAPEWVPTRAVESAMLKGKQSEPRVRDQFAIDHGEYKSVYDGTGIMLVNTSIKDKNGKPFMAATLDGFFVDSEDVPHILEIKRTESWRLFGETLPLAYRAQVLKQMIVTGARFATLVARIVKTTQSYGLQTGNLFANRRAEEIEYCIDAQDERAAYDMKCILAKEREFWNEHVIERKQPPLILAEGRL